MYVCVKPNTRLFSQSRLLQCASVPRRAQVAPSSLLRDSAEIASRLSGLGTSAAFTHTDSCTASWRGNTWALLVLPCLKGDPFTARRVSLSPVVRGQGRSRGGSRVGSWGSPKSQAPNDWLRSFPRDGLPLPWFASFVRDAGAWVMRPSGLSVKFVEPSSASSWSVFSFSGRSWAFDA